LFLYSAICCLYDQLPGKFKAGLGIPMATRFHDHSAISNHRIFLAELTFL
jgi:hypothetical protein